MPELTEGDAIRMIFDFYVPPGYPIKKTVGLVTILLRMNIHKLVMYAFERGVEDMREEK